ncbi:glutamate ligase domain-containing protein, partial [Collinsella stercoris]|uniref:glutamate ligase domain-containing protein n=1 Tax=Collinsella stercoris TaxID=147206 RepID=UPI0026EFEF70
IETLFKSVKAEYPDRRVVALFGAPGGKAQERREALPRVAGAYADHIVYTEDDPAHERVEDICAELASNTPAGVSHEVILDREQAVRQVLASVLAAAERSVVLLLAKGDETRQHRGDEYPEVKSDLAIAREVLEG